MADMFREIDEDVRRDRALEYWKKHGNKIAALAILIVLATAGWRLYDNWRRGQAEAAGARFEEALQLAKSGKTAEAATAFAEVAKSGTPGYKALARFREAAELTKTDAEKGLQAWQALAGDTTVEPGMRDIARLRAGLSMVDTATREALKTQLDPLLVGGNALASNARELLGLAALKAGDFEAAGKFFDEIVTDSDAPPALKQRADLLLAVVRAGPVKPAS